MSSRPSSVARRPRRSRKRTSRLPEPLMQRENDLAAIARQRGRDQTINVEKENQMQTTLQGLDASNSYRKTAITVGVIYLAGMVVGVGGNVIVQSILGAPDHLATLPANSMAGGSRRDAVATCRHCRCRTRDSDVLGPEAIQR